MIHRGQKLPKSPRILDLAWNEGIPTPSSVVSTSRRACHWITWRSTWTMGPFGLRWAEPARCIRTSERSIPGQCAWPCRGVRFGWCPCIWPLRRGSSQLRCPRVFRFWASWPWRMHPNISKSTCEEGNHIPTMYPTILHSNYIPTTFWPYSNSKNPPLSLSADHPGTLSTWLRCVGGAGRALAGLQGGPRQLHGSGEGT